MTLIIGAKCHDGVVLVSDKKIFDLETGENIYSEKLFFPIPGFSIVVGAAGMTNLFREFNSKLPLVVQERLTQYRIQNICELGKIGEKIEDYEVPPPQPTEFQSADVVPQQKEKIVQNNKRKLTSLPYNYSVPAFLDDCRTLIQQIC